jgi:hypothetical protein
VSRLAAVGLLTGWGEGVSALPQDAAAAAHGRAVIGIPRPDVTGDRFRRATRECLLAVAAVSALLRQARLGADDVAGARTGLVYVTAAAYGASNRAFIEGAGGTLHFPYTAPSVVPAEVTIEYALRGPYVIVIGGAAATLDALWQADRLLARGACERALVLAVETFAECADLFARARWVSPAPLVEAAACALLLPDGRRLTRGEATGASPLEVLATRRAGTTLACGPLVAAALACAAGDERPVLTGEWRGRRSRVAFAAAGDGSYGDGVPEMPAAG